ncbi:MAG: hypothetical protein LBC85_02525, partial [Fibromonadaceae bacterium]|nr:hypothetical protein [Fibromonadaceae bacterium]
MNSKKILFMLAAIFMLAFDISATPTDIAPAAPAAIDSNQAQVAPSQVDYWLSKLTVEEKIGQLLMPRLPWRAKNVDAKIRDLLKTVPVGGIALFRDNVETIPQVQALTKDLQTLARVPLFIAMDEEGGRVSRIGRLFDKATPPAFDIGAKGDSTVAYNTARTIGQRLTQLGVNMNFAPIADIWSNPANTVIGNRAF